MPSSIDEKVLKVKSLQDLERQFVPSKQLGIVQRDAIPKGATPFFAKLLNSPFQNVCGKVRGASALADVTLILNRAIPDENIRGDPFFNTWLRDMAEICKTFCKLEKSDEIAFSLETERGCSRFHVDVVPQRLLVTYVGQGTEWIPDEAADRNAFVKLKPNSKILLDPSALQHMGPWDVTVFRGGRDGLLHRTPDSALNAKNLLLRLDHSSFWDNSGMFVFLEDARTYRMFTDAEMRKAERKYNKEMKQKQQARLLAAKNKKQTKSVSKKNTTRSTAASAKTIAKRKTTTKFSKKEAAPPKKAGSIKAGKKGKKMPSTSSNKKNKK